MTASMTAGFEPGSRERMLRAVREVNRLIVRARDPQRLIEDACETLTATLGYYNAWIALTDGEGPPRRSASSGLDGSWEVLQEALREGGRLTCVREALGREGLVVLEDPPEQCPDCPLSCEYRDRAGFAQQLSCEGQTFGLVTVSVPKALSEDESAQGLMRELAEDLGYALHRLGVDARMGELERARAAAEQAHRDSEARFTKAFQSAPALMSITTLAEGRYLDVNETFVKVTGYDREQTLGRTSVELGFITHNARVAMRHALEVEGRVHGQELRLRRADGAQLWCLYSGELIDFDGEACLLSILTDITDRRQAQVALRESETRFRTLFGHMSTGVAIYEAIDEGRDFVFVDMNAAGLDYGQTVREAVVGQRVTRVFPGVDEMGLLDALRRVWRTGVAEEHPLTTYRDGRLAQWVENYVFRLPSGLIVAMFEDTSEARRAESERMRLIRAIEQSAEAVSILDDERRYLYVNPAFERVTGFGREEVLGQTPALLRSGEHDEAFYEQMWDCLRRGEVWSGRIVNRTKDGRFYTEDGVITPVRDKDGATVDYVAVSHDVTEKLALERQLRQAQKMEALGQLTGGVAHDFNNLLQVINGAAELAQLDLRAGAPDVTSLDDVLEAGERAARLVKQLLLFSRREMAQPRVLDLDEVVEEVLGMVRRVIGEHIELVWRPGGECAPILADRGMVEQVLLNLCVNARDAMPDGGRLLIETGGRWAPADDSADLSTPPEPFTALVVRDEGVGMDAQTIEHIFEPFFTTKGPSHGTGLGLATVYGIVKQHGGQVHVHSEPGRGSTFELLWPCAPNEPDVESSRPNPAPGPGVGTILLAEDDPSVRAVTRRMLERAGYDVLTASDGAEALEIYAANADRVVLVILDAVMPRMGGAEASRRLRASGAAVPVVFASGYSEDPPGDGLGEDSEATLLSKPFDRVRLLAAVQRALEP